MSPLAGSSAATIIIFVPLAFLSGVTGAFFKALSLTMAGALTISFFAAWFVVPLLVLLGWFLMRTVQSRRAVAAYGQKTLPPVPRRRS